MRSRRRRDKISIKKYLTLKNIIIVAAIVVVLTAAVVVIALQSSLQTGKKESLSF